MQTDLAACHAMDVEMTALFDSVDLDGTFDAFCQENMQRLRNFLRSQCRDWDLVDDVVQDTLLTTRDAWPRIHGYDRPMGWVIQAARYKLMKHLDQRARNQAANIDDVSPDRLTEPTSPKEAHDALVALLLQIPRRQAQVMYLAHCGWNEAEIAGTLGISRNTVRAYKQEARQRLQQLISEQEEDDRRRE